MSSTQTLSGYDVAKARASRGVVQQPARTTEPAGDSRPEAFAALNTAAPLPPGALTNPPPRVSSEAGGTAPAPPAGGPPQRPGTPPLIPDGSARLVTLPKLSEVELGDLLTHFRLRLTTEEGWAEAGPGQFPELGGFPEGFTGGARLVRQFSSETHVIRFGARRFLSQPVQLWLQTLRQDSPGSWSASPLLATLAERIPALIQANLAMKERLSLGDLTHTLVLLNYIDLTGALSALRGFGVSTLEELSRLSNSIDFSQLPLVVPMPQPTEKQTALLGSAQQAQNTAFSASVSPSVATELPSDGNLAPATQLLIVSHPAHPDQVGHVRRILNEFIDRPARRVFVEGMVLEISEEGLKNLGVEWEFKEGEIAALAGGGLTSPDTAAFTFDSLKSYERNWIARVRALVTEGKAEILSRPSVLTLNNRQATIRIGTDIPIATSQELGNVTSANKLAFEFKYLPTGISLNVRPRVTEDGNEISMLVDTIVSTPVPGADLELKSSTGQVLASAPTVATRRIQTYARIANNTPFIIGGLVSKDQTVNRRKVPILGDIPYLGNAFRSTSRSTSKREVIIVLTPHLIEDETASNGGRFLPKDEDLFDLTETHLFRESYRIRAEDIFDLSFLRKESRLERARQLADEAVARDYRLATNAAFANFHNGGTPGEEILVHRMLYEVVRRLCKGEATKSKWLDDRINQDRLILLDAEEGGNYRIVFLEQLLKERGDGKKVESFFARNKGKGLAISFSEGGQRVTGRGGETMPIPKIRMIDLPDRKQWGDRLWELNQTDATGHPVHTLILQNERDLLRLQRAILIKKIIALNGGAGAMKLSKFAQGKVLEIPEPKPRQFHILDADVASLFFEFEHYYSAVSQRIQAGIETLNAELGRQGSPNTIPVP